jgi:hypothetical protein
LVREWPLGGGRVNELRRAALRLAERGKPVFPCRPAGKEPLTSNGFKDATADPAVVRLWWGQHPTANVGMPTGRPSGLFVLDVDPAHGGMDTMARLCACDGDGLMGLEVETGSGGVHVYLTLPDGVDLSNSNRGIRERFGPGVDCRGTGGYVVVPPSRHPCGGRYTWVGGDLRPVPAWLVEVLTASEPAQPPPRFARVVPLHGDDGLLPRFNGILERVASEQEGNRNGLLYWAACWLREQQAAGAPAGWADLLVRSGMAAGLTEVEARRTVRSGLREVAS